MCTTYCAVFYLASMFSYFNPTECPSNASEGTKREKTASRLLVLTRIVRNTRFGCATSCPSIGQVRQYFVDSNFYARDVKARGFCDDGFVCNEFSPSAATVKVSGMRSGSIAETVQYRGSLTLLLAWTVHPRSTCSTDLFFQLSCFVFLSRALAAFVAVFFFLCRALLVFTALSPHLHQHTAYTRYQVLVFLFLFSARNVLAEYIAWHRPD